MEIILPVVLYRCETWLLTLRVFENRVLRRIFGYERDEVIVEWRKLHNEELNKLYSSPNIVWEIKSRMRWAGHVARMEQRRALVGKPEGKILGRLRHNGKIILRWILMKRDVEVWTVSIWLRIGAGGRHL